jgi:hypothetical protein
VGPALSAAEEAQAAQAAAEIIRTKGRYSEDIIRRANAKLKQIQVRGCCGGFSWPVWFPQRVVRDRDRSPV